MDLMIQHKLASFWGDLVLKPSDVGCLSYMHDQVQDTCKSQSINREYDFKWLRSANKEHSSSKQGSLAVVDSRCVVSSKQANDITNGCAYEEVIIIATRDS